MQKETKKWTFHLKFNNFKFLIFLAKILTWYSESSILYEEFIFILVL